MVEERGERRRAAGTVLQPRMSTRCPLERQKQTSTEGRWGVPKDFLGGNAGREALAPLPAAPAVGREA